MSSDRYVQELHLLEYLGSAVTLVLLGRLEMENQATTVLRLALRPGGYLFGYNTLDFQSSAVFLFFCF